MRGYLRHLAAQGRTVLVSSHVLSEIRQTVDDVVIIARGQLVRQAPLESLESSGAVVVRGPDLAPLLTALTHVGLAASTPGSASTLAPCAIRVATTDVGLVGSLAFRAGVELHELRREDSDLEAVFLELTDDPATAGAPGVAPSQTGVIR